MWYLFGKSTGVDCSTDLIGRSDLFTFVSGRTVPFPFPNKSFSNELNQCTLPRNFSYWGRRGRGRGKRVGADY